MLKVKRTLTHINHKHNKNGEQWIIFKFMTNHYVKKMNFL